MSIRLVCENRSCSQSFLRFVRSTLLFSTEYVSFHIHTHTHHTPHTHTPHTHTHHIHTHTHTHTQQIYRLPCVAHLMANDANTVACMLFRITQQWCHVCLRKGILFCDSVIRVGHKSEYLQHTRYAGIIIIVT